MRCGSGTGLATPKAKKFLYTHKQAAEIKAARHENEAVAETNEEPPASTTNLNAAAAS